jgi:hypothetical protein
MMPNMPYSSFENTIGDEPLYEIGFCTLVRLDYKSKT